MAGQTVSIIPENIRQSERATIIEGSKMIKDATPFVSFAHSKEFTPGGSNPFELDK
jgi:hypothetical protein